MYCLMHSLDGGQYHRLCWCYYGIVLVCNHDARSTTQLFDLKTNLTKLAGAVVEVQY